VTLLFVPLVQIRAGVFSFDLYITICLVQKALRPRWRSFYTNFLCGSRKCSLPHFSLLYPVVLNLILDKMLKKKKKERGPRWSNFLFIR
jgi:hypothetical protein